MSPKAKPSNEVTIVSSIRLPKRLLVKVDRVAKRDKVSRNAKIVQIIEVHLDNL